MGQYGNNACFLITIIITVTMKFMYIMGTPFAKFISSTVSLMFISRRLFPPLHETLHANHIKLFAEGSELFVHAAFRHDVSHKTTSSAPFMVAKRFNFCMNISQVAL